MVDWKTGQPPASAAERHAVAVQLAAYRLAWAALAGVPVQQVRAAFHYIRPDLTVRPADLLGEAGLAALIEAVPATADQVRVPIGVHRRERRAVAFVPAPQHQTLGPQFTWIGHRPTVQAQERRYRSTVSTLEVRPSVTPGRRSALSTRLTRGARPGPRPRPPPA